MANNKKCLLIVLIVMTMSLMVSTIDGKEECIAYNKDCNYRGPDRNKPGTILCCGEPEVTCDWRGSRFGFRGDCLNVSVGRGYK